MKALNPTTETVVCSFEDDSKEDLERKLAETAAACAPWSALTFEDRATHLLTVADLLEARVDEYASIMTAEMGKPIKEARAEVLKSKALGIVGDWLLAEILDDPLDLIPLPDGLNLF